MAQQILDETATSALPASLFGGEPENASSAKTFAGGKAQEPKAVIAEQKTMLHPSRSSSLINNRASTTEFPYAQTPPSGQVLYDHGQYNTYQPGSRLPAPSTPRSGLVDLSVHRAELLTLQRKEVEKVGESRGWLVGWAALSKKDEFAEENFQDVDLDDDASSRDEKKVQNNVKSNLTLQGLCNSVLLEATLSTKNFRTTYEVSTDPLN